MSVNSSNLKARLHWPLLALSVALVALLVLQAIPLLNQASEPAVSTSVEPETITTCIDNTATLIQVDLNFDTVERLTGLCYTKLLSELRLSELSIRRVKFEAQGFPNLVILWMVVAITLSGVALAGLQLLASYRLAMVDKDEFAKSGEFAIEKGRLSLKSSITGLFILIISLAFFGFTFSTYIRLLKWVRQRGPEKDLVRCLDRAAWNEPLESIPARRS